MIFFMILVGIILSLLCLKLYCETTKGLCASSICLKGKTTVVTGANSGDV